MARLFLKDNNRLLGPISVAELKVLIGALEETEIEDDDYFVDGATVSIIEAAGASKGLVDMLLAAIGDSDGIDIRWEK
jgi:hypothetical protein